MKKENVLLHNQNYLLRVPSQVKQVILGCQQFKVAWKPLRQLVWASGESFFMSFSNIFLVNGSFSLSNASVPVKGKYARNYTMVQFVDNSGLSYLPKGYCKQKQNWQWQVEKDMQYIIDFHTNSNPLPGFKLSMTALFVKWIWVVIVLVADMMQK